MDIPSTCATRLATFSADPKIATVDERGWVRPIRNGQTNVAVAVAGQTLTVAVKVQLLTNEPPTSFRHEVMPVLAKLGCNAGACHGYSLGKNGFKLSLRGSDPELDYPAIVKESLGRRVNSLVPESSLLVAKRAATCHTRAAPSFDAAAWRTRSSSTGSAMAHQPT